MLNCRQIKQGRLSSPSVAAPSFKHAPCQRVSVSGLRRQTAPGSARPLQHSLAASPKLEAVVSTPLGGDLPANYDQLMPEWTAKKRRAGVILHPTSLPGPYGIGELGSEAFAMLDWLERAGMQCWQLLPMVLPDPMYYSPYSGTDANCGNPLVISIDTLIQDKLLDACDAPAHVAIADVDFAAVAEIKTPLLQKAAQRLLSASAPPSKAPNNSLEHQNYCAVHSEYQVGAFHLAW